MISRGSSLTVLLCVLFCFHLARASTGDRLVEFRACVEACVPLFKAKNSLPWYLRLLGWDSNSDCDYRCQHVVTFNRLERGESVVQFHGKWPFVRILGAQEPLSVIFSILNFIPHYQGLKSLMALDSHPKVNQGSVPMIRFYKMFAFVGMNAWIWSAVFHTRDFLLTERLDYFSAMACIIFGLYTVVVRAYRLDLPKNSGSLVAATVILGGAYLCHVGYLQFVHFSYTYNMAAGVVFGLLGNMQWIVFSLGLYKSLAQDSQKRPSTHKSPNWALKPILIVLTITGGMAFELFDFAPIMWALDAHALWHAATVLPTYWWYTWMHQDIHYLASQN